jgi:hypothetical protein
MTTLALSPDESAYNRERRLEYEIARAYREHSGPAALRSRTQPVPLAAALATAIRELETAAELTAGSAIQYRIDAKLPALRAALAAARRAGR